MKCPLTTATPIWRLLIIASTWSVAGLPKFVGMISVVMLSVCVLLTSVLCQHRADAAVSIWTPFFVQTFFQSTRKRRKLSEMRLKIFFEWVRLPSAFCVQS